MKKIRLLFILIAFKAQAQNFNTSKDLFASKINYEQANNPNYNGTVSSYEWKYKDDIRLLYDFRYDDQYQLITDDLTMVNDSFQISYPYLDRHIQYDLNGNIESLTRHGYEHYPYTGQLDYILYSYDNQNRLTNLLEFGDSDEGFTVLDPLS
ncbi:MAG: hypothetical protein MRY83_15495, partial [Flavobacteriales bacterium]|nr:hypothetical protein [Flavobacteriales bacterium]